MNSVTNQMNRVSVNHDDARQKISFFRIFFFPSMTNFWPILLFLSQKVFVIPAMLLIGVGNSAYRRDVIIVFFMSMIGIIVYIWQIGNAYDQTHLTGFILFLWSIPIINFAVRSDHNSLRKTLTYLTLFNVLLGVFLLKYDIDLYGLRGLNKVVNRYGDTNRVYFESSSLAAVVLISIFKRRIVKFLVLLAVFSFSVFVAKSVAIVMLLGANLSLPYIMRSAPAVKTTVVFAGAVVFILLYMYLPVIRPDVYLSLQAKQFQLDLITGSLEGNWSGWGWGAFYPQLATDLDQPYQVEMQLPMLMLQIGPIALMGIMVLMIAVFLSATSRKAIGIVRFLVYLLIGFNNPWLFIPSWFLTCQLLFRYDDEDR